MLQGDNPGAHGETARLEQNVQLVTRCINLFINTLTITELLNLYEPQVVFFWVEGGMVNQ